VVLIKPLLRLILNLVFGDESYFKLYNFGSIDPKITNNKHAHCIIVEGGLLKAPK
jgi:hypothetical protein